MALISSRISLGNFLNLGCLIVRYELELMDCCTQEVSFLIALSMSDMVSTFGLQPIVESLSSLVYFVQLMDQVVVGRFIIKGELRTSNRYGL